LAVRFYVINSGRTITMHTENSHLCQVITTFSTGLTALNGLTSQVQYFAVGTSGIDFNISSVTDTHTFNLPTASAINRGALSSADWTMFNNKQNALTNPITGTGASGQVAFFNGTTTQAGDNGLFWDNTNKRLGIGTNTPASFLDVNGQVMVGNGDKTQQSTFPLYISGNTGLGWKATRSNGTSVFELYSGFSSINEMRLLNGQIIAGYSDSGVTNRFRLFSDTGNAFFNGNVGIGTTSLTGRLSVTDTVLSGSGSLAGSLLDLNQTWNTTGTPTALKLNVTNTASNANSLLMDLQVGGSSQFQVTRGGNAGTVNITNFTGRTLFLQGGLSTSTNIIESNNGYSGTSGVFNVFS
jgi:hypothetical protein